MKFYFKNKLIAYFDLNNELSFDAKTHLQSLIIGENENEFNKFCVENGLTYDDNGETYIDFDSENAIDFINTLPNYKVTL